MFKKQKMPFWQLTAVFAVITVLVVALSWGNRTENAAQMDASMADMMSNESLSMASIPDLFTYKGMAAGTGNRNSQHEGHHDQQGKLYTIHIVTTSLLLLTMPMIFAGAVFLAIVWPKPLHGRKGK